MRVLALAALVAAFLIPGTALAQQCRPLSEAEKHLADDYGEALAFTGIDSHGNQVRLYLNAESGSWTLAVRPVQAPAALCRGTAGHGGAIKPNYLPES